MPPPLLYLAALLVGWLLQWLFPVNLVPSSIVLFAAGVLVLLLGLALGFWAIATMRRAGESPNPAEPTAVIVSNGPFRFTRNPIYLGFTLICIGIAIVTLDRVTRLPPSGTLRCDGPGQPRAVGANAERCIQVLKANLRDAYRWCELVRKYLTLRH